MNIISLYKFAKKLNDKRIPFIPKMIKVFIRIVFSCVIPFTAEIGEGTKVGYQGLGIVIHSRAIIGKRCLISQNVTIGGTSKKYEVPVIGDDVYIGAGAKIIGPIKIGNNVVIGANSVVTKNIPNNSLVVGIPAKVIKNNIDIFNYK
ncbi:serine O-acetyltransferase [Clostridium perfringens]